MEFKSNLPEIMDKKSMTYEELQGFAEVSPQTVTRARDERIVSCSLATLHRISQALGVKVKDLFEERM